MGIRSSFVQPVGPVPPGEEADRSNGWTNITHYGIYFGIIRIELNGI